MYKKLIVCTLILWMGCHPNPPKAPGNPWVRKPVNSDETAARLQFCAQLGVAPTTKEPEATTEPTTPAEPPAPVVMVPASAPAPTLAPVSSYVMTVYFSKGSSSFKPKPEQVEELQAHLKGASRIEVRAFTDLANEEKTLLGRALAAKDFLASQGVTPSEVWLNLSGVPSKNTTPEEQAGNRRVEIEVYGSAL